MGSLVRLRAASFAASSLMAWIRPAMNIVVELRHPLLGVAQPGSDRDRTLAVGRSFVSLQALVDQRVGQ
jgi:hypothetical protein